MIFHLDFPPILHSSDLRGAEIWKAYGERGRKPYNGMDFGGPYTLPSMVWVSNACSCCVSKKEHRHGTMEICLLSRLALAFFLQTVYPHRNDVWICFAALLSLVVWIFVTARYHAS